MAILLSKAIARKKGLHKKWNLNNWESHFKKLRSIDKIKRSRIIVVLKWYVLNIGKKYVPEVYSASSFRSKFLRVESAMERTGDKELEKGFMEINISKNGQEMIEVEKVCHELNILYWPKGSQSSVKKTVCVSMNNYIAFLKSHRTLLFLLKKNKTDLCKFEKESLFRFVSYLDGKLTNSSQFIAKWMKDVNRDIVNWETWSGDLSQMVFSQNSKKFQMIGCNWASEYCGNSDRWFLYMEEIQDM